MTYEAAALIHVISAVAMSRSSAMKEVITVTRPARKELIPMAIVHVRTNNTS